jgi:hypothetical protein
LLLRTFGSGLFRELASGNVSPPLSFVGIMLLASDIRLPPSLFNGIVEVIWVVFEHRVVLTFHVD